MRIALVSEWLDTWRGGAETSTHEFVRHLLDLGVELEVFTRSRLASAPGMKVHTVTSSPSRLRNSTLFPRRADAALQSCPCDLIHALVPCMTADIYQPRGGTVAETLERNVALRRSEAARRVKRLVNRLNAKQRWRLRAERRLLNRTPLPVVVAISDYVGHQLARHYGFPESHVRKIYNGVDPDTAGDARRQADRADVRRLHGIGPEELVTLLVAHNFKLKGVRSWIEAMIRLQERTDPPIRSLVVGKDSSIRWQKIVAHAGLTNRIIFAGPTRRIQAYYHAADFLVHPTHYDPCSRVVLESLASRLPCITTRFDGASEVIENGVNGFVIDSPDDLDSLMDRVMQLTDPDLRRRFRERASDVFDRIGMRRHAEEMVRLYESICANGRHG